MAELMPRDEKYLEVGLTPDQREIIVNIPATFDDGAHYIVFNPSQARQLARLLLRKATECKA